jgi:hypothetical protein
MRFKVSQLYFGPDSINKCHKPIHPLHPFLTVPPYATSAHAPHFTRTYSRLLASNWEKVLAENAFYLDVVFCRHLQVFLFCGYKFILSYQKFFLSSVIGSTIYLAVLLFESGNGWYFNFQDTRSWIFRCSQIFLVNISRFWNPVHLAEVFQLSSLAVTSSRERPKGQEECPIFLESIHFSFSEYSFYESFSKFIVNTYI